MPKKKKSESKPKRFIVENIEAIGTAIIVALLFKVFILEISRIPSGSMQPTLMGDPQSQLFDRVLVDKFSFQMRDPERYEIVVFKHPLERSRVMVKRLVGMPGEHFKIAAGDLWTRPDDSAEWTILRRPASVMDEMWKRVDRNDYGDVEWSQRVGEGWRFEAGKIIAVGAGKAQFRLKSQGPLRNGYFDGYPDELREGNPRAVAKRESQQRNVGDVKLSGEVQAEAGTSEVVFEITEGSQSYSFRVPGPAADANTTAVIETRLNGGESTVTPAGDFRLASGQSARVTAINLDDELVFELDGDEVARIEVPKVENGGAYMSVQFLGGGGQVDELTVHRDVHYLPMPKLGSLSRNWEVVIPEGHYVVLGDNTQDSADSRDWVSRTYPVPTEWGPTEFRGNFRMTENPRQGLDAEGRAVLGFRNEWGDVNWFGTQEAVGQDENAPLVPRELIIGRALAVFWPIHRGRFAWLH